jgi:hypothetical protein
MVVFDMGTLGLLLFTLVTLFKYISLVKNAPVLDDYAVYEPRTQVWLSVIVLKGVICF